MNKKEINIDKLMLEAKAAADFSYSPYSHFTVGAAILCDDDEVISAANVENRSYGLTICAERSAIVKAISMGKKSFKAIAVYCGKADYPVSPCGACRQVISEFAEKSMPVYFSGKDIENRIETTIGELFPFDALDELRDGKYKD